MEKEFKEAIEKKIKDEADNKEKSLNTVRFRLTIIELITFSIGIGLIWYQTNWCVLVGILLITASNNIGLLRNIHRLRDNFYKKIWQDY